VIVETARLRLRRLTVDDAAFVLKLVTDPAFFANIGDKGVRDLEDARRFILSGPWAAGQPPGHGQFLVERKEDGAALGVCGILHRANLGLTDVGCAFLSSYRRQGYATEAALAVIAYARRELGVEEIVALTASHNVASIRLLESLGFRYRRTVKMNDTDAGTLVYG
jgi:RimJ/RimL family protein N-acetyltransferase